MIPVEFPAWEREGWQDLAENPIILPLEGTWGPAIGDPQVVLPGEFDDRWHLFCHYGHLYHFVSHNGIQWQLVDDYADWLIGPVSLTTDGTRWILFCTQYSDEVLINVRTSDDLVHWSEPVSVLTPEFDWEREGHPIQVRNPCVVQLPDGRWRLYYCGGTVWLDDCGYEEPKHIGYAESTDVLGPYHKRPTPILSPDAAHWYRSFGTGGMKVFGYGEAYVALINGLYLDDEGQSRSAISVLMSEDGVTWQDAPYNPIILPSSEGWKKAIVYQLDLRYFSGKLWLFYNARDGWKDGIEYIGCSVRDWSGPEPRKLWELPASSSRRMG